MKKLISLVLIGFVLSGCSLFRLHKMEIEQGNIITQEKVNQLRPGMNEAEVKDIMGNPVLVNIFSPDRLDYVYTLQKDYNKRYERRVICLFRSHVLKEVIEN